MNRRYFWQIPELNRFRTVFEDSEIVLGADGDNQHRLFRKDTGKVCFDEQEAKRLCVESLTKDETETCFSEISWANNLRKRITIIGGGASGTLLAVNLLQAATNQPVEINLVDKKKNIGLGVAYSTSKDCHLLNVPVAKMSASPDDTEHFHRWLKVKGYEFQPDDFVPRRIYGEYLREVLMEAARSKTPSANLNIIDDEAVDILTDEYGAQVILKSGEILFSDKVVLAFGNFPPPHPPVCDAAFIDSEKYFQNPWDTKINEKIAGDDDVLIIGTGLSMVDVVLNFYQNRHQGKIFALSTRGLLPAVHRFGHDLPPFNGEITSQFKVSGMLKKIRERIRETESAGGNWRAVIDAMHPVTQKAWLNLDTTERQRFMRHLRRIWDVSRHRMPAECASVLDEMRDARQLHLKKGRILEIKLSSDGKFKVVFSKAGLRNIMTVGAIINCMGTESDFNRIDFPLVKNMLAGGLIKTDPLNLGISALPDGRVLNELGSVSDKLYAIGNALKGVLWETTAIPEIRIQASNLAQNLLARGDMK